MCGGAKVERQEWMLARASIIPGLVKENGNDKLDSQVILREDQR